MNWRNDEHLRDLVRIGNQLGMDAGISTARIIEAIQALKAEVKRSAEQELRWCKWIENLRVNWDGIYRQPIKVHYMRVLGRSSAIGIPGQH